MRYSLILNITICDKYVFSTALRPRIEANLLNQLDESVPLVPNVVSLPLASCPHICSGHSYQNHNGKYSSY